MTYVVQNLDALALLFEQRAAECERARVTASGATEDGFFDGEANAWMSAAYMLRRTTLIEGGVSRVLCDDECVTHCPLVCGIEANRRRQEKERLMGGVL